MTANDIKMAVYVGTYGKYNNGSIEGKWLDLEDYDSKEEFYEACQELHKDESDPEFMFQDWEGIPEDYISESGIDEEFWTVFLPAVNEHGAEAVEAYCSIFGDFNESDFQDRYYGEYESEIDYAYEYIESTGMLNDVPKTLQNYFDYEGFARDLFLCDLTIFNGHVFFNC